LSDIILQRLTVSPLKAVYAVAALPDTGIQDIIDKIGSLAANSLIGVETATHRTTLSALGNGPRICLDRLDEATERESTTPPDALYGR
jgi:hypothetical protein